MARKIIFLLIVLIDLLFVPSLLQIPKYMARDPITTVQNWLNDFNILSSWNQIITNEAFRYAFLLVQPIIAILVMYLFWKLPNGIRTKKLSGIGGPAAAGEGQFGTARWLSEREIDQCNTTWMFKKEAKPERAGLILGTDIQKNKTWIVGDDAHTLLIGATRSGKTRKVIKPSIWEIAKAEESMIITDPKGELYRKTNGYLQEYGYDVVLINIRNPGTGNRWNPMKPVNEAIKRGDYTKASEVAWDIANMIVHQKPHHGDPIWANGQESVLAALILYVAMEAPSEEQKHLGSVYQTLNELGQPVLVEYDGKIMEEIPLLQLMKSLPAGHIAKAAFATAALAPERTRGSFFSGMAADLRLFGDPSIVHLTSDQDHDLADVGRKKTAVFLVIPDEKKTRHFIATLYIDQTYRALVELANQHENERIPNRTNFLIDEFGNMPAITDFDTKITVAAGRGIRFNIVLQDLNQLKMVYKDRAKTISGNCIVWLYLRTKDIETAREISQMTGKYTVKTPGFSIQTRDKDYSASYSASLASRELLTPDEVLRWDNEKYSLVLRAGQNPAQIPLPDLSKYPAEQEFSLYKGGDLREEAPKQFKLKYFIPGKADGATEDNEGMILKDSSASEEEETELAMDHI